MHYLSSMQLIINTVNTRSTTFQMFQTFSHAETKWTDNRRGGHCAAWRSGALHRGAVTAACTQGSYIVCMHGLQEKLDGTERNDEAHG